MEGRTKPLEAHNGNISCGPSSIQLDMQTHLIYPCTYFHNKMHLNSKAMVKLSDLTFVAEIIVTQLLSGSILDGAILISFPPPPKKRAAIAKFHTHLKPTPFPLQSIQKRNERIIALEPVGVG